MIDTHAHLYADDFKLDRNEMVKRARDIGLAHVLLPNIDSKSLSALNDLVDTDPDFFKRMIGLHPCSVKEDYKEQLEVIKHELDTQECIAVGEIGMDLYWDKSTRNIQEEAFLIQCDWASHGDLPIVVHARDSTQELIDILNVNYPMNVPGVFHCFSGNQQEAEKIVSMGMYLGIGGVVTFKNTNLRDTLKEIPLDRILIETDAPYLSPVPYRGKRNESSYIIEVVRTLSDVYSIEIEEIKQITTSNALRLFKI